MRPQMSPRRQCVWLTMLTVWARWHAAPTDRRFKILEKDVDRRQYFVALQDEIGRLAASSTAHSLGDVACRPNSGVCSAALLGCACALAAGEIACALVFHLLLRGIKKKHAIRS